MTEKGALTGIKVVDLSRLLPGPYCSMVLADHGARVIAVEDRRFIADGLFLDTVNRNKEHMSLNLKTDEGKSVLFRLIKDADIFIEGFRPGVVDRLGISYDIIAEKNPGIIYCSITGYGQTGPFKDKAGHDANYLALSGVLDLVGEKDGLPCIPGVQIADITGSMNSVIGILMALYARNNTGRGQHIDISMTDCMLGMMSIPLFFQQMMNMDLKKSDNMFSHRYACYNTYETADGKYLTIGCVENRFWKKLCEHLDVPKFANLQYDDEKRHEIIDIFRDIFKQKNIASWEKELTDLDVCCTPIATLKDVIESPLFKEREMVVKLHNKQGKEENVFGVPIKMSDTPGSIRTPAPDFGEHTESILGELGFSNAEIQNFGEKGVF